MSNTLSPGPSGPGTLPTMDRSGLLDRLWTYQCTHGCIREKDIAECSRALGISSIEVDGVVSFYHFFTRRPAGRHTIYLNRSAVAECKGFERVKEAFEKATGAALNGVDPSGQFGLFETACIGLSDFEPAALIDFQPFTNLNSLKVKEIVARLKQGAESAEICDPVPDHIRFVPGDDRTLVLQEYDRGCAVNRLTAVKPAAVIEEVKRSGVCGMGGAFFPVGLKWEACAREASQPKYIVCNADEGEPGTFKDRVLLNALPGLVLEGMIIAAYAVGAAEGIVYLRAEYGWLKHKLDREIERFRRMNLLGRDIAGIGGFDFDISVQLGAGAYVCGEETALLSRATNGSSRRSAAIDSSPRWSTTWRPCALRPG